jgi:uncharacterized integral membrane protein
MLTLIIFLIAGSVMVYFAQNNTALVTIHFGTYIFSGIPIYYVVIGSILIGALLAYLIYFINSIFLNLSIRKKDNKIKEANSDNIDLAKQKNIMLPSIDAVTLSKRLSKCFSIQ